MLQRRKENPTKGKWGLWLKEREHRGGNPQLCQAGFLLFKSQTQTSGKRNLSWPAQRKEPSVGHGPLHWGLNISQIKQNKQTKKNKAEFWWATIRLTAKWAFLRCITSWKAIPFCGPRTWSSPHGGKGCETKAHSSWGWWIATDTQIVLLIKMMVSYQSDKIPK